MRMRRLLAPTLGVVSAFIVLLAWLLSSPPGSSPDDGYHLSSIWCARGFDSDRCVDGSPPGSSQPTGVVFVPAATQAVTCMATRSTESAKCVYDALSLSPEQLATTTGGNVRGERARLYYTAMSVFVSDDYPRAFFLIRLANVLIALLALTATIVVAPAPVRGAFATTWVVTAVPLGLFLVTSVNSSAWGLVGLTLVWGNALTLLRVNGPARRAASSALLVMGLVMALGARTEALGHLVFASVALLLLSLEGRSVSLDRWRSLGAAAKSRVVMALFAGVAVLVLLIRRVAPIGYLSSILSGAEAGYDRLVLGGRSQPLIPILTEVPLLWTGSFGDRFGLGWLDTGMPMVVYVMVLTCFAALIGLGLQGARPERIAAFAVMVIALVALPTYTLLSIGAPVGESYQPRHYLPSIMLLLGIALVGSRGRPSLHFGRGAVIGLTIPLSIAHAVALHTNIRRYTQGLSIDIRLDLNETIGWWWAHGPSPMTTWVVGSLAFAMTSVIALSLLRPTNDAKRVAGRY
jgi:hypothetical protein